MLLRAKMLLAESFIKSRTDPTVVGIMLPRLHSALTVSTYPHQPIAQSSSSRTLQYGFDDDKLM